MNKYFLLIALSFTLVWKAQAQDIEKSDGTKIEIRQSTDAKEQAYYVIKVGHKQTEFTSEELNIQENNFSAINPDWIKEVSVLKGEKAKVLYGEKGKNGVIIITLKEDNLADLPEKISTRLESVEPFYVIKAGTDEFEFDTDKYDSKSKSLESIKPEWIQEIYVYKDEKATELYGKNGKNGVVIITLKDEYLSELPKDLKAKFKVIKE